MIKHKRSTTFAKMSLVIACVLLFIISSLFVAARVGSTQASTTALLHGQSEPFVLVGEQMPCDTLQGCLEIDFVWKKISSKVTALNPQKIWKPTSENSGEWVIVNSLYLPEGQMSDSEAESQGRVSGVELDDPTVGSSNHNAPYLHCAASLDEPLLNAFLDTIAWAEGTGNRDGGGYNIMVGYGLFSDFSAHPIETGQMGPQGVYIPSIKDYSTAAGRYQFLHRSYTGLKGNDFEGSPLFGTGFSAVEQDRAAWYSASLKRGRGLTREILQTALETGNFEPVSDKVAREWASLPYSGTDCTNANCGSGRSFYGQRSRSNEDLYQAFKTCYDYNTNNNVLLIGASHTTHTYGKELQRLFLDTGYNVLRNAVGGSSAKHWVTGVIIPSLKPTVSQLNTNTESSVNSGHVPKMTDVIVEFVPDIVVISLGTNMICSGEDAYDQVYTLAAQAKDSLSECYWVGPGRIDRTKIDRIDAANGKDRSCLYEKLDVSIQTIKSAAEDAGCTFIDAKPFASIHDLSSDGYHFTTDGGKSIAKQVFDETIKIT